VIVHLAANTGVAPSVDNPRRDCLTNVVGTLNCLEAARLAGIERFVLASSGAAYGASEPPIHEGRAPRPVSPYGASKLAGEGYCSAYWWTFGVKAVALRFGNVYGPGSDHKSSVVATFIKRALAGEVLEIYGDGRQTRDFIFIDDLVEAIVRAAAAPDVGGEVLQIASACETTVTEITTLLVRLLVEAGLAEPLVRHTNPRAGDAPRLYADTTKAERLLGWRPAVPLEEGLRRVVRWFLASEAAKAGKASRGAKAPATAAGA
jgi:UDP-glucose 4-epimerase